MRYVLRCAVIAWVLLPLPLVAQLGITGISTVRGEVRDLDGQPIPEVQVLALSVGLAARTDKDGRFQIDGLPFGEERLLFRRVGLNPVETTVVVDAKHVDIVVRMRPIAQELKPVVVRGRRSGVFGTVTDIADRPAADVEVTVLGGAVATRTDSEGRFSLPSVPAGTFMMTVRKRGFFVVRHSVTLPVGESLDLSVLLVQVPPGLSQRTIDRLAGIGGINDIAWDAHAARRVRCTGANSVFVPREEIAIQGEQRLDYALPKVPSVLRGGFRPEELGAYAIFIDGHDGTGWPLSAISAADVEAVEVYHGPRRRAPTSIVPSRTTPTAPRFATSRESRGCPSGSVWVWLR
jgi:hypothetical protein